MKNLFLLLFTGAILASCSKDTTDVAQENSLDIAKIEALSTIAPDVQLDGTSFGLYRGIFASADTRYHGEIIIQINSDQDAIALVELTNNKNLYFKGKSIGENQYTFKSKEAVFTLDVTDSNNVMVTGSDLGSRPINMRIIKDLATSRAAVSLGTFVDGVDAGFGGTWDLLSTSTTTITLPIPIPPFTFSYDASAINEVVICYDDGSPSGKMFSDTTMESFNGGAGCTILPPTPLVPFFTGATIIDLPFVGETAVDEHAAFNQTSTLGAFDATWNLGRSLVVDPGVLTYVDSDCNTTISGTWSWRGRSGTLLFN